MCLTGCARFTTYMPVLTAESARQLPGVDQYRVLGSKLIGVGVNTSHEVPEAQVWARLQGLRSDLNGVAGQDWQELRCAQGLQRNTMC